MHTHTHCIVSSTWETLIILLLLRLFGGMHTYAHARVPNVSEPSAALSQHRLTQLVMRDVKIHKKERTNERV